MRSLGAAILGGVWVISAASCGSATPVQREMESQDPQPEPGTPQPATAEGPPVAEVRPVTNTYHGVEVVDPYQWLENPEDPAVRAWSDGQNAHARRVLAGLPNVERIRARVREILAAPVRSHRDLRVAGGKIFAIENRPPREQP